MDITQLQAETLRIRQKYAERETKKYGQEWTTSQIMQGMVGDVGDLMKLVMAKEGIREIDNVDEKIAHELSDCLWSILVLADKLHVDLESSFIKTMKQLDTRIDEEKE